MDIVWAIVLVVVLYFAAVILISTIRALMAIRKGKDAAKKTFRKTFWDFFLDFFLEFLNPFNWL